jgi:hypothetical protein
VAVVDAPSFSLNAEKGTLAVPLLGWAALLEPKAPVEEPKALVVVFVLVAPAPKPPPVLPPPNRPPPPVVDPKPPAF